MCQVFSIHVGENKSSSREDFLYHVWSFIVWHPLSTRVSVWGDYPLEHQSAHLELAGTYFLVESPLDSFLVKLAMTNGCQSLFFDQIELVVSVLDPFCRFQLRFHQNSERRNLSFYREYCLHTINK